MDQPVQPELQQMFPPPPHFFSLYREDADGSAERPLPPLPPPIIDGSYQMFGEIHTASIRPTSKGCAPSRLCYHLQLHEYTYNLLFQP
jgi:hypothetical protein